ncbi:MAG TPA: EAL domain-containing protein [Gallionella sp.]|nr:EAL domain-containing protein [Gallionella sp.]
MNNLDHKTAIQSAQLQQLLSVSNVSLITSVLLATILAFMQREVIAAPEFFSWIVLMVLASLLRAATVIKYQRYPSDDAAEIQRRLVVFRFVVLIAGLVWSAAAFLLFPAGGTFHQMQHQSFLIFMMMGLTAGGVVSFSSDLRCALFFIVPIIAAVMLRLFLVGDNLSVAMGVAALLYLGFLIMALRRINGHILENITLRIKASAQEEALRASKERYRSLLGHLPVGILHYDRDLVMTYCNERLAEFLHSSIDRLVGLDMKLVKDQSILPALKLALDGERGYYEGHYRATYTDADGWMEMTCTPYRDDAGTVVGGVAIVHDVSERKQAEERIHQLAFYDPLTLLPNRRLLMDRLQHAVAVGARSDASHALLFIDLDNFKVLNDTRGHDVGDRLLVEAARRLRSCVREGDTVARLGGDEFVVILEDLSVTEEQAVVQAEIAGEKIRATLNQPYRLGAIDHHCSCSIGISLFHDHQVSVDELLKRADTAMYEAKTAGRNALRFFDPAMQSALEARAALENELRQALPLRQFRLYYQKQVNVDGDPVGAEALLRWIHPERGLVPPMEFIPLAEESELILSIGLWVLETACAQIKAWESHPLSRELQLAVNVSARQFHQADFVDQVRAVVDRFRINPDRLKLELTESVVLDDINDTIAKMRELKRIGVRFSMDDFGTGYSSLAYLTQLPLDQLKIDRSFVSNIGIKSTDAVIVQSIINMGQNLGMDVIAEGVETEAQRDFLMRQGCDAYQGFLFGRPQPLDEFDRQLGSS